MLLDKRRNPVSAEIATASAPLPECPSRRRLGAAVNVYECLDPRVRIERDLVTPSVCLGCQWRLNARGARPPADSAPAARRVALAGNHASRPPAERRLRVGFVTPNVVLGGAEYWILGLLKYCDPTLIAWSGIAITGVDACDDEMCRQAARHGPLYGAPRQNWFAVLPVCERRLACCVLIRTFSSSGVWRIWDSS